MKRRNVLGVLGLSFVTLGIYVIYWLYKTRQELLTYSPDKKAIPKVIVLFTPLLALVGTVVLALIGSATLSQSSAGEKVMNILVVLLATVGVLAIFVISFWWFYRYFRTLEAVVQNQDAMLLYTLWIILTLVNLGPIWVLITQNELNKFIDNGYRPLKLPGSPEYPNYPVAQQQAWQPPAPQQQYDRPYPSQDSSPSQDINQQYTLSSQQPYTQQYPVQPEQHDPYQRGHNQHYSHHHQHHEPHGHRDGYADNDQTDQYPGQRHQD